MKNRKILSYNSFRRFKAQTPEAAENEIIIYGPISDMVWWGDEITSKAIIDQLDTMQDAEEITVRLNSPGGAVYEGIAIYNALVRHKAKIRIAIDALAASAASLIAMAGDTIEIMDNSALMIHEPWTIVLGSQKDLRKEADVLDKVAEGMAQTYSKRSGKKLGEVRKIMEAETWLTAEEAVAEGFADVVVPSKEKAKATLADLSIFANVPEWVRDRYNFETPPTPDPGAPEIEKPPVTLQNKKRILEILSFS